MNTAAGRISRYAVSTGRTRPPMAVRRRGAFAVAAPCTSTATLYGLRAGPRIWPEHAARHRAVGREVGVRDLADAGVGHHPHQQRRLLARQFEVVDHPVEQLAERLPGGPLERRAGDDRRDRGRPSRAAASGARPAGAAARPWRSPARPPRAGRRSRRRSSAPCSRRSRGRRRHARRAAPAWLRRRVPCSPGCRRSGPGASRAARPRPARPPGSRPAAATAGSCARRTGRCRRTTDTARRRSRGPTTRAGRRRRTGRTRRRPVCDLDLVDGDGDDAARFGARDGDRARHRPLHGLGRVVGLGREVVGRAEVVRPALDGVDRERLARLHRPDRVVMRAVGVLVVGRREVLHQRLFSGSARAPRPAAPARRRRCGRRAWRPAGSRSRRRGSG